MDHFFDGLNDAQAEAVRHEEGPLLVVAGPGSGKTRVVSRRIAWLLHRGVRPREILAVTFTNRAAAELRERVARLAPAGGLWVATFHSACARILRDHAEVLGYPRAFSIYDEEDRRRLAGRVLRELDIPTDRLKRGPLVRRISDWKNAGVGPEDAMKEAWNPRDEDVAKAYALYERLLRQAGAMDFDDLLVRTHRLFEDHPQVLEIYRRRLRHVLVDEYQDTNRVQFLLAKALASGSRNLCATGDPDQSVYGWRGADIRNILDFEEHYPDARVVRLERNYRSVANVLRTADALISRNLDRRQKRLVTGAQDGPPVRVTTWDGAEEEGAGVAATIRGLVDRGVSPRDIAVFYRVNARSRAVEISLRKERLPYQVVRGVEFFQRAEVKDLIAWLRMVANPRDGEALARICGAAAGVGEGSVRRLLAASRERGVPARDALLLPPAETGVRGRAGKSVAALGNAMRHVLDRPFTGVQPLLENVMTAVDYRESLMRRYPEDHQERWENVTELLGATAAHDAGDDSERSLEVFLEEVALVSDQDRFDPDEARVTLMTLHTSKGLEFPVVFVVGVEEGVLPHARSIEDARQMEEERRLMFVGMTRAQRELHLSCGLRASGWTGGAPPGPSRFLEEIGETGVERMDKSTRPAFDARPDPWGGAGGFGGRSRGTGRADIGFGHAARRGGGFRSPPRRAPARSDAPGRSDGVDAPWAPSFDDAPPEPVASVGGIRVGQRVRHVKFGTGRVRNIEERGAAIRATVEFRRGVKTLDLAYAHLEPLGEDGA